MTMILHLKRHLNGTLPETMTQSQFTRTYSLKPINAHYARERKELVFLYVPSKKHTGMVYACRSFDCVAHETGHAILDQLKPKWHSHKHVPQTGALHEAFGDLSAIFLELSQMDQVNKVISQTGGDLTSKNFIAKHAIEISDERGRPSGWRNANNDLKLSDVRLEVHALSQVFTAAIYHILAKIINQDTRICRSTSIDKLVQLLFDCAAELRMLLLRAIRDAPNENASFADVAQLLVAYAPENHKLIIRREFEYRDTWLLGSQNHETAGRWRTDA